MVETLYEDEDVVALWSPGGSDATLFTFGDALGLASGDRFFADVPVRKADISAVGIMARRPNWFPEASMRRLASAIGSRFDDATARVGYGGSMGGYGAIKYSALLGLTHTIALCPQWSIDPLECDGHDPGFRHWYRPEFAGHHVRPEEVAGRVVLIFDPKDPIDGFHGARLQAAIPSAHVVALWNVGHYVTKAFVGTANLTGMIAAITSGDMAALGRLASRLRRASPERAHNLLSAASGRKCRMAARAHSSALSGRRNAAGHPADYQLRLLDRLLTIGADREVRILIRAIAARNPDSAEAVALLLLRHDRRRDAVIRRIGTMHGSWLAYDVLGGRLKHVTAEETRARPDDLLPIHADIFHGQADLLVSLFGLRFRLDVQPDGYCRPVPFHALDPQYRQGHWLIEPDSMCRGRPERLAFRGKDGFLCAVGGCDLMFADRAGGR